MFLRSDCHADDVCGQQERDDEPVESECAGVHSATSFLPPFSSSAICTPGTKVKASATA